MILFKILCGIDRHKYAFSYGNDLPKKPIISSGVILEDGTLPMIVMMKT